VLASPSALGLSARLDRPLTKQAGDFGTIIEETGELWVEGNIYSHVDTEQIASQYPAVNEDEVDHIEIQSHQVQGIDIGASAAA